MTYYINRGLETKFTLDGLRKTVVGKQVVISYAKHWHILPVNASKHIGQLKLGEKILYSEF